MCAPLTGEVLRATKITTLRYERDHPCHTRQRPPQRVGYDYVHAAVDDHVPGMQWCATDNDAQVRIGRPDRRSWVSCDLTPDAKIIATYTPAGQEQAFIHAATPAGYVRVNQPG